MRDFVRLRYTELLRLAYLLTGSPHDAEDLVQSALLNMLRRWRSVDEPLSYARRTVINLYVNSLRRRTREVLTSLLPERSTGEAPDRIAQRSMLWPVLRTLPPRTRAVIVARYWLDMSEAETAQLLGCSIGTVKSTASRGVAKLRSQLEREPGARNTFLSTVEMLEPREESR